MSVFKWCNIIVLFSLLVISCNKIEETKENEHQPSSTYFVMENGDSIICTFEKYMSLQPIAQAQGGACYGDYFIQGYKTNEFITIYNLKDKLCLATLSIPAPPPSSMIHANTLNFGRQKYDENDYFPLLYVSSGYVTNNVSYIYVYRLLMDSEKDTDFSISLVQTISLTGFDSWTEGIIDAENSFLWVKYEKTGVYGYARYELPTTSTTEVVINYEDYLQNFILNKKPVDSSNQGHLFVNNRILLVSGIPKKEPIVAFISINTLTEQHELILDLSKVGLHNNNVDNYFEPESLIFYDGQLMICYRKAIYILKIQKVKNGVPMIFIYSNVINNNNR